MYQVKTVVQGVSPLLHHRFPIPNYEDMNKGGTRSTGAKDYSQQWRESLYVENGMVYQPASHFELSMTKAAASFKVTGKRGKTYKDLVAANVFIDPEKIPFGIIEPQELDTDADKELYLDLRPVVIQRARVVRIRPAFKPGWKLEFTINVIDDELPDGILQDVLIRPKFGRFSVMHFEVLE